MDAGGTSSSSSRGLDEGQGFYCVGQDLSLQVTHLQSGRHSNFHFLCSAGRYTPLLGKCPPDYSPLQNMAEEFRLLSDSANEEIQTGRTGPQESI